MKVSLRKTNGKYLLDLGIIDSRRAYIGPEIVELDLTNDCNLHCAGCWCHSYLLGESMLSGESKKKHLPYKVVKRLIDDLYEMGTETIQVSGSGEPFLHPEIMNILKYIKKKPMKCNVITNFTLINKKIIEKLIDLQVDNITVSLWAGTPETYVKAHPGTNKDMFYRIEKMLKLLHQLKKDNIYPYLKLYNVISSLNCHELEKMLDFALETRVDFLEFTVIDIIPGKTDSLMLSYRHKENLIKQFYALEKKIDYPYKNKDIIDIKKSLTKGDLRGLGKYMKRDSSLNDFLFDWEDYTVICPNGIKNRNIYLDEVARHEFVFKFNKDVCRSCERFTDCPVDNADYTIRRSYLSLLGFGSFYRRVMNIGKGLQDEKDRIVDTFPCYAGWIYSRVRVNGDVIPCCKAHRVPVGNLHKHNFRKIWNSQKQQEFRDKGKNVKKSDAYFSPIGCYKGCDNLGENLKMHKYLQSYSDGYSLKLNKAADIIKNQIPRSISNPFFNDFVEFRAKVKRLQFLEELIKKLKGEHNRLRKAVKEKDDELNSQKIHFDTNINKITEENKAATANKDKVLENQRDQFMDIIKQKEELLRQQDRILSRKEKVLKNRRNYFMRVIEEKDNIIAQQSIKLPERDSRILYRFIARPAVKIWKFGILMWLLFLKVCFDGYMLALRIFCKKRIFPGG